MSILTWHFNLVWIEIFIEIRHIVGVIGIIAQFYIVVVELSEAVQLFRCLWKAKEILIKLISTRINLSNCEILCLV